MKCLLHPELVIEFEYRKCFPELTHAQYVSLRNDPDLIAEVREELRSQEGLPNYVLMIRDAGRRALDGDRESRRWYCAELDLSEEKRTAMADSSLAYQKLIADVSKGVGDVLDAQKKKPKVIDTQAEVK